LTTEAKTKLAALYAGMNDAYWKQACDAFNDTYETAFSLVDLLKEAIDKCLSAELSGKELKYTGYGALLQAEHLEDERRIEQDFKTQIATQRQDHQTQQLVILDLMETLKEVCCIVPSPVLKAIGAGK